MSYSLMYSMSILHTAVLFCAAQALITKSTIRYVGIYDSRVVWPGFRVFEACIFGKN